MNGYKELSQDSDRKQATVRRNVWVVCLQGSQPHCQRNSPHRIKHGNTVITLADSVEPRRTRTEPSELMYVPCATSATTSSSTVSTCVNVGRSSGCSLRHASMVSVYVSGTLAGTAGKSGCRTNSRISASSAVANAEPSAVVGGAPRLPGPVAAEWKEARDAGDAGEGAGTGARAALEGECGGKGLAEEGAEWAEEGVMAL